MSERQVHHQRAVLLQNHGRHQEAVVEWTEALAGSPQDPAILANRALCLLALERLPEAQADADAAIALDPDDADHHHVRALVLRDRGRQREAIAAAMEAVRINPEDAGNHALVAELALRDRRWQDGLAACDAGLAAQPDHLACINLRAVALRQLGRLEEASATVVGALQRAPNDASSHTNQGWSLLHQGRHREAERHFLEALRLRPDFPWARDGLITSLKARSAIYRTMLAYMLWMSRLRAAQGQMVVIGTFLAYQLVARALADTPWFWPVISLCFIFFLLTWIADPLGDLTLFTHPIGRHALSRDQRRGAILVGSGLLLAGLVGAAALIERHEPHVGYLAIVIFPCLSATMLGSLIFRTDAGWRRTLIIAGTCVPLSVAGALTASWVALASGPGGSLVHRALDALAERTLTNLVPLCLGCLFLLIASQFIAGRRR